MNDGYDGGDSSGAWFMGKQLLSKWLSGSCLSVSMSFVRR